MPAISSPKLLEQESSRKRVTGMGGWIEAKNPLVAGVTRLAIVMHLYARSSPAYRVPMVTGVHLHVSDHGRSHALGEAMIETNGIVHSFPVRALTPRPYLGAAAARPATGRPTRHAPGGEVRP